MPEFLRLLRLLSFSTAEGEMLALSICRRCAHNATVEFFFTCLGVYTGSYCSPTALSSEALRETSAFKTVPCFEDRNAWQNRLIAYGVWDTSPSSAK